MYYDTSDPNIVQKIALLAPTPGYCVFIDIVGSTLLKDEGIQRWATIISNTFVNARFYPPLGGALLKIIGDELMFYLPESQLSQHGENALTIFAALTSILGDRDPIYAKVKAAGLRGQAYALTFVKGQDDYYGKDIDLCARLLATSGSRRLVMNDAFVEAVRADYEAAGNKEQFPEVLAIRRRCGFKPKGFSTRVRRFMYRATTET